MTELRLAILEAQLDGIRAHFFGQGVNYERIVFLMFSTAEAHDECRGVESRSFQLTDILMLRDADISASPGHVSWDNNLYVPWLRRAAASHKVVGIAHSHMAGPATFSAVDDDGERGLSELVRHRNGPNSELISLVFTRDGELMARLWKSSPSPLDVNGVRVVGKRFQFFFTTEARPLVNEAFVRQALAFGDPLNQTLRQLRITVVGVGGTGSAVAVLLARLGVGYLNLVDPDTVEESNLNRVHGATLNDAKVGRKKVDVLAEHVTSIGLGTSVCQYSALVTDSQCRDVLRSSDVIFGCTDDHSGRLLLNRFAYFYFVPVIDVGLAIEVSRDVRPKMLALDGRVTVLVPPNACLNCRGVVDPARARAEHLRRVNPEEYVRQKNEAYVVGEGDPNPSVVTFTTEVATMAVNEMLQRLQNYRGSDGSTASRTRLFHRMHDLRPGDLPREDCPICGDTLYWGRGDVDPFLDQVW
jgi:molybdopterin/thiamine biosynthesis adenylyltransferase